MALVGNTVPGFTLQSENFMVKFISGFLDGVPSQLLEYETDWMEVMLIILDTLETFPTSVMTTQNILSGSLENWVISHPGAEHLNIKANVTIQEKAYFTPPLGSKKSLRISFTDTFKTEVLFYIKKKCNLKSLKNIGAAAVVDHLEDTKDIAELEIPTSLIGNLVTQFNDDWTPKFYRNKIQSYQESNEELGKQDYVDFNVLSSRSIPFLQRSTWIYENYKNHM